MSRNCRRIGFTLIEVLIVVVIMAVLAATIIPQFSSSTKDAKDSTVVFNLQSLRSQIELYRAHHFGTVPDSTTYPNLKQLITKTKSDGTPDAAGPLGPYVLNAMPVNPFNDLNTVKVTTDDPPTTADGSSGWLYNNTTGGLWANDTDHITK
ncbi:MAG: prepilin-type N-terminal cleavage/methylation domain-containing protein [Pirellulales bacterium]